MATGAPPANKPPFNPLNWFGSIITLMDRYIATELVMPFLFSVVAFSCIILSIDAFGELFNQIVKSGLPITVAFQILLLKLPRFVNYAFPMSMLLACLMVYGRLSGDSELIALRSCGVSVYRLVAPAIALGLIVTLINFAFNESITPAANLRAAQILNQALNKVEPSFRERNIFYQEFRRERQPNGKKEEVLSRTFYAKEYDGKRMKGLTILDFSKDGLNQIVASESAEWNPAQKTWDFFNGTIYLVASDGSYRNIVRFDRQELKLPRTPLDIANTTRDDEEMNIAEITQYIQLLEQTGNQGEIRKLQLRRHEKMAIPFACVPFGLVGATMGIRPQRSSRVAGFGISLLIILSYYFLWRVGGILYGFGFFNAFLAGWLPTMTALAAGLFLLFRLNR